MTRALGMRAFAIVAALLATLADGTAHELFYETVLSGTKEAVPNLSPGTGTSMVMLDLDLITLRVETAFSSLAGTVTGVTIYGPATAAGIGTAGAMSPAFTASGFPTGVTAGSYDFTFDKLMGGTQLPAADMDALAAYLLTLMPHPNPNRLLDDSLPATFAGGDPVRGELLFNGPIGRCSACHSDDDDVVNNIDSPLEIGGVQPIKNQRLRTVYQRLFLSPQAGATSPGGFGLLHDGAGFSLPKAHPYALDQLGTPQDFADVAAFVMCFETGWPPLVGASRTFTAQNANDAAMLADLAVLENQVALDISEVVALGVIGGRTRTFYQQPGTYLYAPDTLGEPPVTRAALLALLGSDDAITFLGMPYGRGPRVGGDRNYNGILDRDEPGPALSLSLPGGLARLRWPAIHNDWLLESTPTLGEPWETVTLERATIGDTWALDDPILTPVRFYRLRRTW